MARIYTHTGDKGTTSLVGGKRVPKEHPRLWAYGTIDELQSHLGLLVSAMDNADDIDHITAIQRHLFNLGSRLATESPASITDNESPASKTLELWIDQANESLPPLHSFILPQGCEASARAHVCRTICRRAERHICTLAHQEDIDADILPYINRLSDYLFILARRLNHQVGIEDTPL